MRIFLFGVAKSLRDKVVEDWLGMGICYTRRIPQALRPKGALRSRFAVKSELAKWAVVDQSL